ncbi:MAG: rhodanese-related sulfurtransferase [Parachlamydiales bacterium]|nr:rhodanese-related sulfurtransferase [Parachlamydiales bacterium]
MSQKKDYVVLAYYHFFQCLDPHGEVDKFLAYLGQCDATSRIYISEEGINGQMSIRHDQAEAFMEWVRQDERFAGMEFKIQFYHEHVFPRLTVKYRKQLVAIDFEVDRSLKGHYLTPQEWKEHLDSGQDHLLLDVRNDYEWKIGHFKGATLPPCSTFRDFPDYADQLKESHDPKKTKVLMYCTGGIRCEIYSSLLKQKGFENVFQLEGGIIKYGEENGNKHWKGKLFVFDDRLSVPMSEEEETISICHHCQKECDTYLNCANMDCNELFTCCDSCTVDFTGCCCEKCKGAPRVRPYHKDEPHKPFRRYHLLRQENKKK